MKAYQFEHMTTAFGRSRRSTKTIRGYCWEDAVRRLRRHVGKKWAGEVAVYIFGATVDGTKVNPDLIDLANAGDEVDETMLGWTDPADVSSREDRRTP